MHGLRTERTAANTRVAQTTRNISLKIIRNRSVGRGGGGLGGVGVVSKVAALGPALKRGAGMLGLDGDAVRGLAPGQNAGKRRFS